MAERPNALALKASVGETTGGSNPSASAVKGGAYACAECGEGQVDRGGLGSAGVMAH